MDIPKTDNLLQLIPYFGRNSVAVLVIHPRNLPEYRDNPPEARKEAA
jgi:hypothetical protein